MAVSSCNYPGSAFLEMDFESTVYYEGKHPGTVSISGYSEEYREQQLLRAPLLNIALAGTTALPVVSLDAIVDRIRKVQLQPIVEDDEGLKEFLGLTQYVTREV
jgi:hypothetical protein